MQCCLILGIGHKKPGRFLKVPESAPDDQTKWVTLDVNPDCNPDVVFDLNRIELSGYIADNRLPFDNNTFDEIHAYEVMEHYGRQGDYAGFFTGMRELWRVLKPDGYLFGTCPGMHSLWAWGDPGHTRVISAEAFSYLTIEHYSELGKSASSDYRRYVHPCWWKLSYDQEPDDHIHFSLQKQVLREAL